MPAVEGARQPDEGGALLSEEDACERLRSAALDAYETLGCDAPEYPDCPGFLRPGGGSGCYEYSEDSIAACEKAYEDARSCRVLSPCLATAQLNLELPTCEQVIVDPGAGGAGGAGGAAGAPAVEGGGAGGVDTGGAPPVTEGGSDPGVGGHEPVGGSGGAEG